MLKKIVSLQLFWLFVVLVGNGFPSFLLISFSIVLVLFNFHFYRPKISIGRYLFILFVFLAIGYFHDLLLIKFKLISRERYTIGYLSLWVIFLAYFGDVFNKLIKLSNFQLAVIGGLGGMLSYWSASKIGALNVLNEMNFTCFLTIFIMWSLFFPISIWLFYTDTYWDYFLDYTVLFSFDKTGFLRHKTKFTENIYHNNLHQKTALVTGGTSGIGNDVANTLALLGANVNITGRDTRKNANIDLKFYPLDLADWDKVHLFAQTTCDYDYIVLNAGGMPDNFLQNSYGVEYRCASQLLGHYYLIINLKKYFKINSNTRIVWVSSGGMYLKSLDLDSLNSTHKYDKVATYANIKRAQVTLVEELSQIETWNEFKIFSMHPGWVATAGLKNALPGFYNLMKKRLRSTHEGADTILWLLLTNEKLELGGLYFDRKKARTYIFKRNYPNNSKRKLLMDYLDSYWKNIA